MNEQTTEPITEELDEIDFKFLKDINTPELEKTFEKIRDDLNGWYYNDYNKERKYESILELFPAILKNSFTWEDKAKGMLEEVKTTLLMIFELVDTIFTGSTHKEKDKYCATTIRVLEKKIDFFDQVTNDQYFTSFFRSYEGKGSLYRHYELMQRVQELENERKQLQAEINALRKRADKEE